DRGASAIVRSRWRGQWSDVCRRRRWLVLVAFIPFSQRGATQTVLSARSASALRAAAGRTQMLKIFTERNISHASPSIFVALAVLGFALRRTLGWRGFVFGFPRRRERNLRTQRFRLGQQLLDPL